jgi:hypothetical protein
MQFDHQVCGPARTVESSATGGVDGRHWWLFVIQSALMSWCSAPLCSSERIR